MKLVLLVLAMLFALLFPAAAQTTMCGTFSDEHCWTTPNRPANPGIGTYGFNLTFKQPEWWDGTAWISASGGSSTLTGPITAVGPNEPDGAAFRTFEQPPLHFGNGDFTLYSKPGPQGFPVTTIQGWGRAGATAAGVGGIGSFQLPITGGTGYTPGTHRLVALTCISCASGGSGARFDITVNGSGAVTTVTRPFFTGTNYSIGDIVSAAPADLGPGAGFQAVVASFSSGFALDLLPFGFIPEQGQTTGVNGVVWQDTCNRDIVNFVPAPPFTCNHLSVFGDGDVFFGTSYFGQTGGRVMLGDNGLGSWNWIYYDGTFHTQEGRVRGFGTTMSSSATSEDTDSNLITYSNDLTNAAWAKITANVVAAPGVEDPWGTNTAQTITSTAPAGYVFNQVAVPNDTATYTASVYIHAGPDPVGGFVRLTLSLQNGVRTDYSVVFLPTSLAIGSLGPDATGCSSADGGIGGPGRSFKIELPRCYGFDRIQVGCEVGCTGTGDVWYRLWVTGQNNNTGNTLMTIAVFPHDNATGSLTVAGAQISPRNLLLPHIPTTAAPVQRTPGPVVSKQYFTSSSVNGVAGGGTQYYAVGCGAASQICQGVFPISGTLRNLYTTLQTAPGGAVVNTMTLMAGTGATPGATTITCTITGAATTCNDLTHVARVAAGDRFNVRSVAGGGAAGSGYVTFGFELSTP